MCREEVRSEIVPNPLTFPIAINVRRYDESIEEHLAGTYHQIESVGLVERVRWRAGSLVYLPVWGLLVVLVSK